VITPQRVDEKFSLETGGAEKDKGMLPLGCLPSGESGGHLHNLFKLKKFNPRLDVYRAKKCSSFHCLYVE
jgi:hypothetical protein